MPHDNVKIALFFVTVYIICFYENHDLTIAISSTSCADTDSVLDGVEGFKCLYQSCSFSWKYLNV